MIATLSRKRRMGLRERWLAIYLGRRRRRRAGAGVVVGGESVRLTADTTRVSADDAVRGADQE